MIRTELREAREAARLSLHQLAVQAGITKAGLWEIEMGHVSPRLATAQALARALGTTVEALFPTETEEASA